MLEARGNAAYALAKARTSVELSREHVRLSKTAIIPSQDLLARLRVFPSLPVLNLVAGSRSLPSRSAALHVHTPAELRAQAAHARQLADEMYNRDAQAELREIANALDADAEQLELTQAAPMPPASEGA